ncbi:hypothetical protein ARTHROSP310_03280 [Arthrobacter sp. AD-310]
MSIHIRTVHCDVLVNRAVPARPHPEEPVGTLQPDRRKQDAREDTEDGVGGSLVFVTAPLTSARPRGCAVWGHFHWLIRPLFVPLDDNRVSWFLNAQIKDGSGHDGEDYIEGNHRYAKGKW